ncbi:MAG: biotin--[acetyl-CoA-carboxylase] ligase [Clostridiales bacterium]|nr:biotin--[acetyl-CoA-carboxylase] ligase [Eubacteriales bacterium]MDH7566115.1 biotin--[acetyl-CoA-carboxylase] ligase [Clostridiales bacterium]
MKHRLLQVLKENSGRFVSGEELGEYLKVSRTAVWKHIKELKQEGCLIQASTKKGYKLIYSPDVITEDELKYDLNTEIFGSKIFCFNEIDSTNNYAKKIALEGCDNGTVIIADRQLSGRGRMGRTWHSPAGKGIWMSVVLRPSVGPEDVQMITLAASVAVVDAVRRATGIEGGIKWPNDIVLDGKKVCGILTEMSSELDQIGFLVIGIGINVNHGREDFDEMLRDKATSLRIYAGEKGVSPRYGESGGTFARIGIVRNLLQELEAVFKKVENNRIPEIIEKWKRYSVTLGREVRVTSRDGCYTGVARDITPEGKLVVYGRDGVNREVLSGEIQVRGLMGYV